jgi:hypothetical protein
MKRHILIQLKKNLTRLPLDRIIPDNHPNIFQLTFILQNLKNDSLMETGIILTQSPNTNISTQYIQKKVLILEDYYLSTKIYI